MNTNLTFIQKLTELKTKLYSTQIQFISSINSIFTHIDGYIQSYSNDTISQQSSNTDIQSQLKYSETQFDQINEIMKRNDKVLQIQSQTKSIIEKCSTLLNDLESTCKENEEILISNHNKTLKHIQQMEKTLFPEKHKISGYVTQNYDNILKKSTRTSKNQESNDNNHVKFSQFDEYFSTNELIQLEANINRHLHNIIFDSDVHNWGVRHSDFSKLLFNQSQVVIFIQTSQKQRFGCYINSSINKINKTIEDTNAFIFRLNGKHCEKYPLKDPSNAFRLFDQENMNLFVIDYDEEDFFNKGSIVVKKRNKKNDCSYSPSCFDDEATTVMAITTNTFTIDQLVVFSTTTQDPMNLIKEKEMRYEMNVGFDLLSYHDFCQIEHWTQMMFEEKIFDSEIEDWNENTSQFDSKLIGKQNIVIIIEDEEGNIFGTFLKNKITNYKYLTNDQWCGQSNVDPYCFIFSLKSLDRNTSSRKYDIKVEHKYNAFTLYKKESDKLFEVGSNDIVIMKEGKQNESYWKHSSIFDYDETTIEKENLFSVKRIHVWQMKQNDQHQNIITDSTSFKEYASESKLLKTITMKSRKNKSSEMKKAEYVTKKLCDKLVFDSHCCDWNINTSTFDKRIFGIDKILFIIEDDEGNSFGAYIESNIDSYCRLHENKIKGQFITDGYAIIFRMKTNGKNIKPIKYRIWNEYKDKAFSLFNKDCCLLFTVGENDIVIMKNGQMTKCKSSQNAFDYKKHKPCINGKIGKETEFNIKHIQVWEMKENTSIIDLSQEEMKIPQYIHQIEYWTGLIYKETLFDSNVNSWAVNKSEFDNVILNKEKLAFFVETQDGIVYGGFIYELIDGYKMKKRSGKVSGISDEHSFVFTFKNNSPVRYRMKKNKKKDSTFFLYENKDERLFSIGIVEVFVKKQGFSSICLQNDTCLYDYGNEKNALTGITGKTNLFKVKRIIVFQFE